MTIEAASAKVMEIMKFRSLPSLNHIAEVSGIEESECIDFLAKSLLDDVLRLSMDVWTRAVQ